MSKEKIVQALASLDVADNEVWTDDGAPRVGVVAGIARMELKRKDITEAWPGFSRDVLKAKIEADAAKAKGGDLTDEEKVSAAAQAKANDPSESEVSRRQDLDARIAAAKGVVEAHDVAVNKLKKERD